MLNNISIKKILLVLFIICSIFNVLISFRYWQEPIHGDAVLYEKISLSLLHGEKTYEQNGVNVDLAHEVTPFYSAFISLVYFISSQSPKNVFIVQIFFNCLTILFLFLIVNKITSNKWLSFLSSLLFIFYYPLWRFNFNLLMEIPSVFILSLSFLFLVEYFVDRKKNRLFLSVFVLSILVLINNRFIAVLAVLLVAIFIYGIRTKSFNNSFIILLISFLTISPWFVRQYWIYHQFVFFTPIRHNSVAMATGLFQKININEVSSDKSHSKIPSYVDCLEMIEESHSGSKRNNVIKIFTFEKYNALIKSINLNKNVYLDRIERSFKIYNSDFFFFSTQ